MQCVQGYVEIYTLSVNWHKKEESNTLRKEKTKAEHTLYKEEGREIPVDRDKVGGLHCTNICENTTFVYLKKKNGSTIYLKLN